MILDTISKIYLLCDLKYGGRDPKNIVDNMMQVYMALNTLSTFDALMSEEIQYLSDHIIYCYNKTGCDFIYLDALL